MHLHANEQPVAKVVLRLTRTEAVELQDALADLMSHLDDPAWLVQVSSENFGQEITLAADIGPRLDRDK